jgi:hypothetical protein
VPCCCWGFAVRLPCLRRALALVLPLFAVPISVRPPCLGDRLPCVCRACAASFPRLCRAFAVRFRCPGKALPCLCRAFAVLPCICGAFAVPVAVELPWSCRSVFAVVVCRVFAVLLPCCCRAVSSPLVRRAFVASLPCFCRACRGFTVRLPCLCRFTWILHRERRSATSCRSLGKRAGCLWLAMAQADNLRKISRRTLAQGNRTRRCIQQVSSIVISPPIFHRRPHCKITVISREHI